MADKENHRVYITAVLTDARDLRREYDVTPITVIGRADDAHIQVDYRRVSRTHAKIVLDKEAYYLEDVSANGTLVNGKLIKKERCWLKNGDIIEIRGIHLETGKEEAAFKAQLRVTVEEVEEKKGFLDRLFGRRA